VIAWAAFTIGVIVSVWFDAPWYITVLFALGAFVAVAVDE
jgi:hypothetical protein